MNIPAEWQDKIDSTIDSVGYGAVEVRLTIKNHRVVSIKLTTEETENIDAH